MVPCIRRSFETIERQKTRLLEGLSKWPAGRLAVQPSPTTWSALHVLDHLVKVENSVLQAVKRNLPSGHPIPLRDRISGQMVILVMRSPIRVKVPQAASQVTPSGSLDLPQILKRWTAVRTKMAELLDEVSPGQLRCGLLRHPVGGWMTLPLGMTFLSVHLQHHTYQLRRLQRVLRES